MPVIEIPSEQIADWDTFHAVVARELRFPDYYGMNGNAFIDCLRDIVEGRDAAAILEDGEHLTLDLGDGASLRRRCPEQFEALVDWTSFVNAESIDYGRTARVLLAFRSW